jgi:hypothetical protein
MPGYLSTLDQLRKERIGGTPESISSVLKRVSPVLLRTHSIPVYNCLSEKKPSLLYKYHTVYLLLQRLSSIEDLPPNDLDFLFAEEIRLRGKLDADNTDILPTRKKGKENVKSLKGRVPVKYANPKTLGGGLPRT